MPEVNMVSGWQTHELEANWQVGGKLVSWRVFLVAHFSRQTRSLGISLVKMLISAY